MGKMFGKSPARDYLGIEDNYMALAVDFACFAASMEDENKKYADGQENAQNEAGMMENVLENYRKQIEGGR